MSKRNQYFTPERQPFRHDGKLQLAHSKSAIGGPLSFLNPTRAQFNHRDLDPSVQHKSFNADPQVGEEKELGSRSKYDYPASKASFLWRSRDNRKGRHALRVEKPENGQQAPCLTPRKTSHPAEIARNTWRMLTLYPYWDVSWLVAYFFVWGSIVWVINAFFAWLPVVAPSTEFNNEEVYGGGITAFIGAVIFFEAGSVLLMFEAVNENSAGCFGWALENLLEGDEESRQGRIRVRPERRCCTHHHQNKHNFVGPSSSDTHPESNLLDKHTKDSKTWQWLPSWQALRCHYFHELGFLASLAQFIGATIFSIAGITALPGINNHLSQPVLNGIYWVPQIVGGSGFIISGTLFMLETQENWYTPAFGVLGWHIGL